MTSFSGISQGFDSVLSFQPLAFVLKKMIADGKPGARRLYEGLLKDLEQVPGLLQPMDDPAKMDEHQEILESLLTTIFPPSTNSNEGIYAVTVPFQSDTIYTSPDFARMFLKNGSKAIQLPDKKTSLDIVKANLSLAYNIILKKIYSQPASTSATSVHPFYDETSGLTTYFELNMN